MENLTLFGVINKSAEKYPSRTALYYKGVNISYRKLASDISAMAAWLEDRGIIKGDVVTICMPNIPQTVVCLYAVNKIGAIAHMVHPLAPTSQLDGYMKKVNSKMLILLDITASKHNAIIEGGVTTLLCSPAFYLGKIKNAAFNIKNSLSLKQISKVKTVFKYREAIKSKPTKTVNLDCECAAVYLHSGGTSGEPKTICLSSKAINSLCQNSLDILCEPNFSGGSMLAVLPTFHGFGLAMGVHGLLCFGGCDTLMPKFSTAETIKLISKNKINYLIGVPTLYEALLRRKEFSGKKLRLLKCAFVGGDFVPTKLIERFNERMEKAGSSARLYEGYGLTETVTVCAVNTAKANKVGSIGKPLKTVEMAVFDGDIKLKSGEKGELCISANQLMSGYLGENNDPFFNSEGKKWVRSGDMGYIDGDGFVFFKSRIKRIAKVNGITVFPSEIENLCMNSIDEIREAHAIALYDEGRGSMLTLFVSTAQELDGDEKLKLTDEINELVESTLSVYAKPSQVFFVRELPKTLIGKIDENKLKQIYL